MTDTLIRAFRLGYAAVALLLALPLLAQEPTPVPEPEEAVEVVPAPPVIAGEAVVAELRRLGFEVTEATVEPPRWQGWCHSGAAWQSNFQGEGEGVQVSGRVDVETGELLAILPDTPWTMGLEVAALREEAAVAARAETYLRHLHPHPERLSSAYEAPPGWRPGMLWGGRWYQRLADGVAAHGGATIAIDSRTGALVTYNAQPLLADDHPTPEPMIDAATAAATAVKYIQETGCGDYGMWSPPRVLYSERRLVWVGEEPNLETDEGTATCWVVYLGGEGDRLDYEDRSRPRKLLSIIRVDDQTGEVVYSFIQFYESLRLGRQRWTW